MVGSEISDSKIQGPKLTVDNDLYRNVINCPCPNGSETEKARFESKNENNKMPYFNKYRYMCFNKTHA